MNIAIFTEVTAPYVSGISSYVEVLQKGLARLGHNVVIVTSSPHIDRTVMKNGIIRCPAKKKHNKYGYECKNVRDTVVMELLDKFRPEIVHIQTDTRIGYLGLNAADRYRCPVVFTIHDYYSDRFAGENRLVWLIKTFFEKRHFIDMIDNAQVITSSNSRASEFIRDTGRRRRVMLIHNGTDKTRFDYRKCGDEAVAKMRNRLGVPKDAFVAVFAGDLSVDKNLEFVLSAFSRKLGKNENIHLLIVGGGTELEYLRELCVKMKISDRVHFPGVVAHSIMPQVYSACDVYVCSSEDGLMSMSFVEAMACGLPVLVKEDKDDHVNSMIEQNVNGFVFRTREELAGYLRKLRSLPKDKRAKLRFIVRNSMNKTDSEYMAKRTEKAYLHAMKAMKINVHIR